MGWILFDTDLDLSELPDVPGHTCNPSIWRLRQEDHEFEDSRATEQHPVSNFFLICDNWGKLITITFVVYDHCTMVIFYKSLYLSKDTIKEKRMKNINVVLRPHDTGETNEKY
jgi:hypothetical protein